MSDYPEHDKMSAIKDKSQTIGEFLDSTEYVLCLYDEDDRLRPVAASIEQILALYFDIDLNKIEAEKRAMLDALRASHG